MSIFVNILLILNIFAIITVVFLERKNPVTTIAWLFALVCLPIVGFVLYLFFGRGFTRKKDLELEKEEEKLVKALVAQQLEEVKKMTVLDEKYKQMITMNLEIDQSICTDDNTVTLFTDGQKKFDHLIEDLKNAKNYIHMLYYIIEDDVIGTQVLDILGEKVRQGVEVKVIFDALGHVISTRRIYKKYKNKGIEVNIFSPVRTTGSLKANYRNHRKLIVIDGDIGYIGGMNLADSYRNLDKRLKPWRDTHLRIEGSAAKMMELRFILDYRHTSGKTMKDIQKYVENNTVFHGSTPIQIVSSGPHELTDDIKLAYIKMINSAEKYVYIQTPYFIPDEPFVEAIRIACYAGVDVRVMIPGIPDKKIVYMGTLSYVQDLLQMGAKVYTYNGFLHAKTIVCDDEVCSVGSANMDIRSFRISFESNAFMYDKVLAKQCREAFEQDMLCSKEMYLQDYEKRSIMVKMGESICRLLSPLM